MNRDCENSTRAGDCLTRNSRRLCESCDSLLSDDERDARELQQYISDARARQKRVFEQKPPRKCAAQQKWGRDANTCIDKNLTNLCAFCLASLSDAKLRKHAKRIIDWRSENRAYWRDHAEQEIYLAELKAAGAVGVDWNIEYEDASNRKERAYLIFSLFIFGKPCFIHPEEMEQAA